MVFTRGKDDGFELKINRESGERVVPITRRKKKVFIILNWVHSNTK